MRDGQEHGSQEQGSRLAKDLSALAYVNRLRLLSQLQVPRSVEEIDLQPENGHVNGNPDRTLTRQGIQYHLDQLREAGFLDPTQSTSRQGRACRAYGVEGKTLTRLIERLSMLVEKGELDASDEAILAWLHGRDEQRDPTRPYLTVVRGSGVGQRLELTAESTEEPPAWTIGSGEDAEIRLIHDPLAAPKNSQIIPSADGFELLDLRVSNGTYLDFDKLEIGETRELEHGGVIGVGRSLLLYREP